MYTVVRRVSKDGCGDAFPISSYQVLVRSLYRQHACMHARVCIAVYLVDIECLVSEYIYSLLPPLYLGSDIVIVLFCLPNYPFGYDTMVPPNIRCHISVTRK